MFSQIQYAERSARPRLGSYGLGVTSKNEKKNGVNSPPPVAGHSCASVGDVKPMTVPKHTASNTAGEGGFVNCFILDCFLEVPGGIPAAATF